MQIHLPIHEAAADEVVLDGVNALLIDHELVVHHVEHVDDARGADVGFVHACEEGVALQVVEAVHVEL